MRLDDLEKEIKPGANNQGVEENAEDLYENAPCGYLSSLSDGTIVKINQTLLNWLGYQRAEVVNLKRLSDLLSVGSHIFYETHLAPLLQMQGSVNEISIDLKRLDRQFLPCLMNTVQHRDAAGQFILNRSTFFNITDRKKYERELLLARKKAEQATKAKADFLSMMSHEIRTPLNAIIGVAHLMHDTKLSPQQLEFMKILQFSSEHLLDLINDILDFSKIEAGKVTLQDKTFDLRKLVFSTVYSQSAKADEKKISLNVDIDEKIPRFLRADPVKMGQILNNLLSNALKFTEKGSVTLSVRANEVFPEAALIEFKVIDTGIGIAEDRLAQVFEEFTQADQEIGVKYGGTGLGLAISQKLLGLYGSKMKATSVLGKGSTFAFALRLEIGKESDVEASFEEINLNEKMLKGLSVLIAEDNVGNIYVLSRFLQKWGVDFHAVHNGREAVERVRAGNYDLVLMDLQMPEMNGYEATSFIRSLPDQRFMQLPIIALSASTRFDSEDRLESANFTDFVGKPFRPDELFRKIARHCHRSPEPSMSQTTHAHASSQAVAEFPRFKLEGYLEAIDYEAEALLELGPVTIESYESAQHEIKAALTSGDMKHFDFQVHKIAMSTELLQAQGLRSVLQEARLLLQEQDRDPIRIRAVVRGIKDEIQAIVDAIQQTIDKANEGLPL